jgi:hypothetical protein
VISRNERILRVLGFAYAAAQFLTLGVVFGVSSAMLLYQSSILTIPVLPMTVFCLWVAWLALRRVRAILNTPYY